MGTQGQTSAAYAWRRDLYVSIGERVRALREQHKLSMRQLAERVGCGTNTLQKVEQGALPCPVYLLVQFAELFDTTLDDLVPVGRVELNEPTGA